MTLPQWSRPGMGSLPGTPVVFILGVRPNSPMTRTRVLVEQAAGFEVFDEGGDGGVEDGEDAMHAGVEAGVPVPAAVGEGDETGAGLDEAAGEQGALAPGVAAVAVAEAGVFGARGRRRDGRRR